MTAQAKEAPGGIDLNLKKLNLDVRGDKKSFSLPIDVQNISIDGLTPMIINIIPLTDLPAFLGFSQNKEEIPSSQIFLQN